MLELQEASHLPRPLVAYRLQGRPRHGGIAVVGRIDADLHSTRIVRNPVLILHGGWGVGHELQRRQ